MSWALFDKKGDRKRPTDFLLFLGIPAILPVNSWRMKNEQ
jgi:hypothetical protein